MQRIVQAPKRSQAKFLAATALLQELHWLPVEQRITHSLVVGLAVFQDSTHVNAGVTGVMAYPLGVSESTHRDTHGRSVRHSFR